MIFVQKSSDKAYIYDYLWLPKRHLNEGVIKDALSFWVLEKDEPVKRTVWKETEDHILVPREFIAKEDYPKYSFDFVDLTPASFPSALFSCNIELRDHQVEAYEALLSTPGGVLNLAPGKGKTVLALKLVADMSVPALVVVHNSFLMEQWKDRIATFLPGVTIGTIQSKKFDWEHPIVVATVQTLGNRARTGDIPEGFNKYFGLAIFDEVHHLAAPTFLEVGSLVLGKRVGLTATVRRQDGLENMYLFHLGKVFFKDTTKDLVPLIYFQKTPINIDTDDEELRWHVRDVRGEISIPKMRTYLGANPVSNAFRYRCIKEALDAGRKIMCLSHAKNQLIELHSRFPGSGLIISETPQKDRPSIVAESQLVFSIASLGSEGLDDEPLDTLIYLTPFSSANELEQSMGRIQRAVKGKKTPVFIIMEDNVSEFISMCRNVKSLMRQQKLKFTNLEVPEWTKSST